MKVLTLIFAAIAISTAEVADYSIGDLLKILLRGAGLTADMLIKGESTVPIEVDVSFWLINRQNPEFTKVSSNDVTNNIDPSRKVGFLIHGWIDNGNRTWIREAATEWIKYDDINVIIVDWNRLANYEYTIAANSNTRKVGVFVAEFIRYLEKTFGIRPEDITITGHSLGGQIAGFTGAALNGTIGQIIALDPAGPLFTLPFLNPNSDRLDSSDAKFVQVIHTSKGLLGVYADCGHQDFYPNGGDVPQSGCILPLVTDSVTPDSISCSHFKAISYFTKSLNPEVKCKARECATYPQWLAGGCILKPTEVMGIWSTKRPGRYFFKTTHLSPYCNGL